MTRTDRRSRRIVALLTVAPLALAATLTAGAGTAQAASGALGNLTVSPTSGVANSPTSGRPTFTAGQPCPAGASAYDALMNGPAGSGWTNVQALGNTSYDTVNTPNVSGQLSDTFAGIAAANATATSGKIPAGAYTVTFRCLDQFGSVVSSATGDAIVTFGAASSSSAVDNPWHMLVSTTTTLSVSPVSPTTQGTSVTLTAHLSPTNAVGSVQFSDGGTNLGTPVAVASGVATLTTSSLAVGTHSLTAAFTPTDATAFTSSQTAAATSYTVNAATPTSTALAASPTNTAAQGATVTLTATVSPSAATGTVQFMDGSTNIGTAVSVSGGTASTSTAALAVGGHSLSAVFTPGGPAYGGSTSSALSYTITGPAPTSTTLSASPSGAARAGSTVTLNATVSPAAAGSVQFMDGATAVGSAAPVASGAASTTTSSLSAGTHTLTAVFTPTDPAAFQGSTSNAVSYVITTQAPQLGTLTITSATASNLGASNGTSTDRPQVTTHSTDTANPGCTSQSTDMNAHWTQVSRTDNVTPSSTWSAGLLAMSTSHLAPYAVGAEIANAPLDDTWAGIASFNSATIDPGHYTVRLDCVDQFGTSVGYFVGDVYFIASGGTCTPPPCAPLWQTTNPVTSATPTSLVVSASPTGVADLGTPVTLTATVTPGAATGTVQFQNTARTPAVNIGSAVTVVNGTAQLTTSSLPFGMYQFQATFTPANSQQYGASASSSLTYAVRYPAPPTFTQQATLLGAAVVDRLISCTAAASQATSLSYQWLVDGNVVASGPAYRPAGSYAGHGLACRALASNAAPTPAPSTSTSVVVAKARFGLLRPPSISGAYRPGYVLTANPGYWSPTPSRYAYQWFRNGRAIYRATGQRYKFTLADRGQALSVRVTALRLGYVNGVAYGPRLRNLTRPTVTGIAHPGRVLSAHVGTWGPAAAGFQFQWLRDGVAIPGAVRSTYTQTRADRGHVISARVVALRGTFAVGVATAVGLRCS